MIVASEFPPGPGGIGTHAYHLASHLAKIGCDVLVCAPQAYAADEEVRDFNKRLPFQVVPLRAHRLYPLKVVDRWQTALRCTRTFRPHAILASGDPAVYLGSAIAGARGVPWIAVEHGRIPVAFERNVKRWAFNRADAVVAVSNYSMQRITLMGVRPRSGHVIHNGADAERFRKLDAHAIEANREKLNLQGKRVLLTVGNVTARKGQDLVIKALPEIRKCVENVLYVMVGLPTRRNEFEALASELGVEEHVRFVGRASDRDLVDYLNLCDLFLMTSRRTKDEHEGFGIAVVEAALCGKTSVVSDDAGIPEAIVDGETGLAVDAEDVDELATSIVRVMNDDALRVRLERAAYERARSEQTWPRVVRKYHDLLSDLAGLRSNASPRALRTVSA